MDKISTCPKCGEQLTIRRRDDIVGQVIIEYGDIEYMCPVDGLVIPTWEWPQEPTTQKATLMGRPPKYKTEAERREAQRAQNRRSARKRRREGAGVDEFASLYGERQNTAKLTAAQATEIRSLREREGWTITTLARQFGVSERAILAVLKGEAHR